MTITLPLVAADFASMSNDEPHNLAVMSDLTGDNATTVAAHETLSNREPSLNADWGRISPRANLGRLTDARILLPRTIQADITGIRDVLHYDPASARVPEQDDPRWERDGGGTSHLHPDMLRLVGLAGVGAQYVAELPTLDNQHGTVDRHHRSSRIKCRGRLPAGVRRWNGARCHFLRAECGASPIWSGQRANRLPSDPSVWSMGSSPDESTVLRWPASPRIQWTSRGELAIYPLWCLWNEQRNQFRKPLVLPVGPAVG